MAAIPRILGELNDFNEHPVDGFTISSEANPYKWTGTIIAPDDSPYKSGVFDLDINFPQDYPFNKPDFRFKTKIYHPAINIDLGKEGEFCSPKLASWKTTTMVIDVLKELREMMLFKSFKGTAPLALTTQANPAAVSLAQSKIDDFFKLAAKWTKDYAS